MPKSKYVKQKLARSRTTQRDKITGADFKNLKEEKETY